MGIIPQGQLPRYVDVTVGEENRRLFHVGNFAWVEGHCTASPQSLLDCGGPPKKPTMGSVRSFIVLLEFVRLIPIDELPDDFPSLFHRRTEDNEAEEVPMPEAAHS
jgi:hypothetical protein